MQNSAKMKINFPSKLTPFHISFDYEYNTVDINLSKFVSVIPDMSLIG